MMAFRSTPATESTGFSPYQLLFGKQMKPVDIELMPKPFLPSQTKHFFDELLGQLKIAKDIARNNMEFVKSQTKEKFDKNCKVPDFQINDKVLLRQNATKPGLSQKLSHKWEGPYLITHLGPNFTYKLKHCHTNKVMKPLVNAKRVKHYQENLGLDLTLQSEQEPEVAQNDPLPEARFEVQEISSEKPDEPQTASARETEQFVQTDGPQTEICKSVGSDSRHSVKLSLQDNENTQPTTEQSKFIKPKRIFQISSYKGERWFRCYIEGKKYSLWLREYEIDPDFLCQYWESHTKTVQKRKRKRKGMVFWKKKVEE